MNTQMSPLLSWTPTLFIALLFTYFGFVEPQIMGDTIALVTWARNILACVARGQWSGCSDGGHFPLLQYIPAFILSYINFSDTAILRILSYINTLCFFLLFFTVFKFFKKNKIQWISIWLILASGPLLPYARLTFGEMIAATLTALYTLACIQKSRWWVIAFLFLLAGITKDIAFPFLLMIAMSVFLSKGYPGLKTIFQKYREQIFGITIGMGLTFVAVCGFNFLRTGSIFNMVTRVPEYFVPTWTKQLDFFLGLWWTPNSGMMFFWPSFCFLVIIVTFYFFKEKKLFSYSMFPLLGVVSILFGLTFGLSKWWAPFGWIAWGPRLLLPWIPALAILLISFYPEALRKIVSIVRKKVFLKSTTIFVFILFALSQFLVLFDPNHYAAMITTTTPECPVMPYLHEDVEYYYHCMGYRMWHPHKIVLFERLKTGLLSWLFPYSVIYGIMLLTWLSKINDAEPASFAKIKTQSKSRYDC